MSVKQKLISTITSLTFLLVSGLGFAQKDTLSIHYIGLKGGMNFTTINLNVNTGQSIQLNQGITTGIVYRYFSKKTVGLQLEFSYTEKGGVNFYDPAYLTTGVKSDDYAYFNLYTDCVDFLMLTHLRFGKKLVKLKFEFGPNVSYTLSEEIKFINTALEQGYQDYIDYKWEYGINVGVILGFVFNRNVIEIGARYNHGFSNLFKVSSINNVYVNTNQGLSFTLGYYYHTNKKKEDVNNK